MKALAITYALSQVFLKDGNKPFLRVMGRPPGMISRTDCVLLFDTFQHSIQAIQRMRETRWSVDGIAAVWWLL